jgi:tRNA(adenine34) deaminase
MLFCEQAVRLWMQEAIREAKIAADLGEVPVGAVLVYEGEIIAKAHNEVETGQDATKHAEMLALLRASAKLGRWRLSETKLIVTLEPCPMCYGAIMLSRVDELYFGCYDPRLGAVGSLFDLSQVSEFPHRPSVYAGVLENECSELLSGFFKKIR